jgi:hypothetical protein
MRSKRSIEVFVRFGRHIDIYSWIIREATTLLRRENQENIVLDTGSDRRLKTEYFLISRNCSFHKTLTDMLTSKEIIELKKNIPISRTWGETIKFARELEKLILQRAIERIEMNDNGSGDEWDRAIRASVTQLEESLR